MRMTLSGRKSVNREHPLNPHQHLRVACFQWRGVPVCRQVAWHSQTFFLASRMFSFRLQGKYRALQSQ